MEVEIITWLPRAVGQRAGSDEPITMVLQIGHEVGHENADGAVRCTHPCSHGSEGLMDVRPVVSVVRLVRAQGVGSW